MNRSNQYITIIVFITRIKIYGGKYVKRKCGINTMLYISGKTMDSFQYIWVVIIDEMYRLIVKYLGNGFR